MSKNYNLVQNYKGLTKKLMGQIALVAFSFCQFVYMANIGYASTSGESEAKKEINTIQVQAMDNSDSKKAKIYGSSVGAKTIYIYNDEGSDPQGLTQISDSLQEVFGNSYRIEYIDSNNTILGQWKKDAALFIMPGGTDLGYVKKLQGAGNSMIKDYVNGGGSYLGICAGAYYGASYIEFDKGGNFEVVGPRELQFFDGKAIGPAIAQYSYENTSGARAAQIELKMPDNELNGEIISIYFNGGPYFIAKRDNYFITHAATINNQYKKEYSENISDLERGKEENDSRFIGYYRGTDYFLPAIVQIDYGQGSVILSGVHLEYNYRKLDSSDQHLAKVTEQLSLDDSSRFALLKLVCNQLGL